MVGLWCSMRRSDAAARVRALVLPRDAETPPQTPRHPTASSPRPASHALPASLLLELVAAVIDSGAAPAAALRATGLGLAADADARAELLCAASAALEQGVPVRVGPHQPTDLAALNEALRLSAVSGLPPAGLVRRAAEEQRRRVATAQARAVRRLEVLLVLPVGLCLLPAFAAIGVVPMVIDLIGRR